MFRFAYSRPGFLTFKIPGVATLPDDFDLHSVFARAYGFSLGKATGSADAERAVHVWQLAGERQVNAIHVWQRDLYQPGYRGHEPGPTKIALNAELAIIAAAPVGSEFWAQDSEMQELGATEESEVTEQESNHSTARGLAISNRKASDIEPPGTACPGQMVLDCVIVEPNEWWIGYHRAASISSRWSGGMFPINMPSDAVSRAYLKMEEALAWSRMPLQPGDVWAEIGSAPGGSSQALLSHGLRVIGIDPADMEPVVLANPNFTHWKKRGADVRRREYRNVRYLTADINVAPSYTLDTVESIVTHSEVNIRGLILTLKLLDWNLADELPNYLDRVRSWGYRRVRARQLHHNRQEICVFARRDDK